MPRNRIFQFSYIAPTGGNSGMICAPSPEDAAQMVAQRHRAAQGRAIRLVCSYGAAYEIRPAHSCIKQITA